MDRMRSKMESAMTGWTVHTAAESIPITDQYAVTSLSRSRRLFSISLTSFWKNGMKKRRNHEGAIHDVRRSFT
jgi:hypothetical protein